VRGRLLGMPHISWSLTSGNRRQRLWYICLLDYPFRMKPHLGLLLGTLIEVDALSNSPNSHHLFTWKPCYRFYLHGSHIINKCKQIKELIDIWWVFSPRLNWRSILYSLLKVKGYKISNTHKVLHSENKT